MNSATLSSRLDVSSNALWRGELEKYLGAMNKGDLRDLTEVLHRESPFFEVTKLLAEKLFSVCVMHYELLDVAYVGGEDDYAFILMKQKVIKLTGPDAVHDSMSSLLLTYKQAAENSWKIWATVPLRSVAI